MNVNFLIDRDVVEVNFFESIFSFGKDEILSVESTDLTYHQYWYNQGFEVFDLTTDSEFSIVRDNVSKIICDIAGSIFDIEHYHRYVNEETHRKVISKTRDLFPQDFSFNLAHKLEEILGFGLTDIDPDTGKKLHIILRINRPKSNDFNPPHKDIYESLDRYSLLPKLVNFWIPICGVTNQSMLPIVPESHLIPENRILRTCDGGNMNQNKYRVRSILNWNGENIMMRPLIKDKQILVFTPHLIHGCAFNNQEDMTRVALEYRLFKKDS